MKIQYKFKFSLGKYFSLNFKFPFRIMKFTITFYDEFADNPWRGWIVHLNTLIPLMGGGISLNIPLMGVGISLDIPETGAWNLH